MMWEERVDIEKLPDGILSITGDAKSSQSLDN